ncbi:mitochondrial amidoxime-reducing component 1-like [Chenopodium quinoa]|uniref:MOSC domain-containing protein n=1 Tax=Chenopodium quinoa TaxID=63459 RepID=A0A803M987_CHEQI|nr:mitochondrial amidoxime-reducing component 1-like [Chenopodium quinoa]
MEKESGRVKSIFVYPIKSCRGISVAHAPITSTGFRWDRQWMIVNANGRMITQRVEPKLALIEIELPSEAFSESWEPSSDSYMVIRAPGMDTLKVSLGKPRDMVEHVSVWNWNGSALDEGATAAAWLSSYIGKTSRLVRFDPASQTRATNPEFANGYKTMFSDQFPFLLISQGSLDALNKSLKEPVPINRFRPNILVEGCGPFTEDLWKEIKINKSTFVGVRLCSRCKIPTINQETGIAGSEPNKTLMEFRSDKVLLPNKKPQGEIYVGQHLVCKDCFTRDRGNVIQVGDPVYVVQQLSSTAEAAA